MPGRRGVFLQGRCVKGRAMSKRKGRPEGLREAITKGLVELYRRTASPYDGLLGPPPAWIPSDLREQFEASRDFLLNNYPESDVRAWLKARAAMEAYKLGVPWPPSIAPAAEDKVDRLIRIREIVELGPDKGLRSELAKREHQRALAQRPRRPHPVDAAIEERLRANPKSTWKEIQRGVATIDPGAANKVNKDRVSRVRKKFSH